MGFLVLASLDLAKHSCWHQNFQNFPRILHSFFELRICWINEVNLWQPSSIVKFWLFRQHICVSLFVAMLRTYLSVFLATSNRAWMLFASSSIAPQTMYIHPVVFHLIW